MTPTGSESADVTSRQSKDIWITADQGAAESDAHRAGLLLRLRQRLNRMDNAGLARLLAFTEDQPIEQPTAKD